MRLGDVEVLKRAQIRVGSIFRMELYPQDRVTPKGEHTTGRTKYFVIVGVDVEGNYVGVSLINTNVNINFARVIAPFQHCIYPEKYEFLQGQYRYVDCYMIRDIEKSRISDKAEYIGYLDPDDLDRVRALLRESPAIDMRTIKRYGLE